VYPGIDVAFHGNQRSLEYDFNVSPGADPRRIVLGFSGARGIRLDAQGSLVLRVGGAELRELAPVAYQLVGGRRHAVSSRFVLVGSGKVGISTGSYDRRLPLVIDPVLSYSTYLGGSGGDQGFGIAVDGQGNTYVTGNAQSSNAGVVPFPTKNPIQADNAGGSFIDAFVTKLNPQGSALVYSTYLGGTGRDDGMGIAVDGQGSAYVTGSTQSSGSPPAGFPTQNPFQPSMGGGLSDAFLTKLNPQGSALVYSTYLGGTDNDFGAGVTVDAQGNANVTG
jgi:hypothetical protein